MAMKAQEFGIELDDRVAGLLTEDLKRLEADGYVFEAADASLELLMRRAAGWVPPWYELEGYRVTTYNRDGAVETEATIKLWTGDERHIAVGEGNGPVNALDSAFRRAIGSRLPALANVHLTDFRVRILDNVIDTGAVVRVLIESTDGDAVWTTIGVSTNIIEASWNALNYVFGLLRAEQ
jgi:2-isopropylmalate synthase